MQIISKVLTSKYTNVKKKKNWKKLGHHSHPLEY